MAVQLPVPTRVARPELSARMVRLIGTGGLLLVAGAGYGKSTAVEEALREWGGPSTWIGM
ncbi:MAG: hypothetical protein AVDCRST_MAG65-171, partial [uncultured Solirubrobacteraceae bacterium]